MSKNASATGSATRPDRRVARTRRRLKEALIELLAKRSYDRITVQEIVARADVGRSTFYTHYETKDDLLFDGFDQWVLGLGEPRPAGWSDPKEPDPLRFSLPLLHHFGQQRRFALALLSGRSDHKVRKRVLELLTDMVRRELAGRGEGARQGTRTTSLDGRVHLIVGAFTALAVWWLEREPGLSPEAVDQVFRETIAPGV